MSVCVFVCLRAQKLKPIDQPDLIGICVIVNRRSDYISLTFDLDL